MGRKLKKTAVFNDKEYKRGEEYFKTEEEVDYAVEELRDSGYCAIKDKNFNEISEFILKIDSDSLYTRLMIGGDNTTTPNLKYVKCGIRFQLK